MQLNFAECRPDTSQGNGMSSNCCSWQIASAVRGALSDYSVWTQGAAPIALFWRGPGTHRLVQTGGAAGHG